MPKAIVTIAPAADLDVKVRRAVERAARAVAGLEPSASRIAAAVRAVHVLVIEHGMSSRAVEYYTGTSKGNASRLHTVATRIGTRDWSHVGDASDAIVHVLYTIASYGGAADVTRAADMAHAATDGDAAYAAVAAVRDELRQARTGELTAKPASGTRAVGGTPDVTETEADRKTAAPKSDPADGRTDADRKRDLSAAGTLTLLQVIADRVTRKGGAASILADAATASALSRILAAVNAADPDALASMLASVESDADEAAVTRLYGDADKGQDKGQDTPARPARKRSATPRKREAVSA